MRSFGFLFPLLAFRPLLLIPLRGVLSGAVFIMIGVNPATTAPAAPQQLRAAVAKIDLTPDKPKYLLGYAARQSTGVLDRIHHRILVLDDGATRFILVSSEFCVISPSLYDEVAGRLERRLGIPRINFWWTLTHTHSAPEVGHPGLPSVFMADRYEHRVDKEYTTFVENTLVDGVTDALGRLEPVRLGVGWGHSNANINRRARALTGPARLGMNPDGPVDRRIGVIRLDRADGNALAIVANYAIHGTALGGESRQISGDVPGVVACYLERRTGAVALFVNGAAGNLAPIYSVQLNPRAARLDEFELLLGERVVDAFNSIGWRPEHVTLRAGILTLETPRRSGLGWPGDLGEYSRPAPGGGDLVRLPVRFLRINDEVAIWGAPIELFCEISNEIRERSPFQFTFYFGYLNGWLGYLPTASEFERGGYEPRTSPFTAAAESQLRETVLGYLNGELKR